MIIIYDNFKGRVIEDWIEKPHFSGNQRTLRVWLDTNQYHSDMTKTLQRTESNIIFKFQITLKIIHRFHSFVRFKLVLLLGLGIHLSISCLESF